MIILPPIRTQDEWGSGEFQAPRGNRKHNGIDYACYKGSIVTACHPHGTAEVTKIGYPYDPTNPKKGHLRYVQLTDEHGIHARYFYIEPLVELHEEIERGDVIGKTQGLVDIYPGITDHFHIEIKDGNRFINPQEYVGEIS